MALNSFALHQTGYVSLWSLTCGRQKGKKLCNWVTLLSCPGVNLFSKLSPKKL